MIKGISDLPLEKFVTAARSAAEHGLLKCSSGNMSWRLDDENAAVTASRCWLGRMTKEDVVICRINDGKILHGRTPSVETKFHMGILKERADVNVVLHYQSPYATAIACSGRRDYDFNVIPEIPYYIGAVGFVDFILSGSEELANAVIDCAKTNNMVLLQNHGLVTFGKDFDETILKACFFELACQIMLCGRDLVRISPEGIAALKQSAKA